MHEGPLVCDTTVLLYLGRVGLARLLPELFESVIVPEQVAGELDVGRQLRSDTLDPRALSWATMVNVGDSEIAALPPNDLGLGERSVIAHALSHPETTAGLDDRAARDPSCPCTRRAGLGRFLAHHGMPQGTRDHTQSRLSGFRFKVVTPAQLMTIWRELQ